MLTRATSYGVKAVCLLAKSNGENVSCETIARRGRMPASFLVKVLQRLAHGGLLTASRGPGGGYHLARAPERITLLEIAAAIDGPISLRGSGRTVKSKADEAIRQAEDSVTSIFSSATVADWVAS